MKAYVTSTGEKTTQICCDQLKQFGFDVVLLDAQESWINKYNKFIATADEDCLRIDADIITSEEIFNQCKKAKQSEALITSFALYDLYRNGVYYGSPLFYKKEAVAMIRSKKSMLHPNEPERSACRMDMFGGRVENVPVIVGMHGFFQKSEHIDRARKNKIDRKQDALFDFGLVNKLMNL